jgi:hypothetical protein
VRRGEIPDLYFPDPTAIEPLGTEFVRMMFAHTGLEREVSNLQAAIKGDQEFAGYRWRVHEWPEKMAKLIGTQKLIENDLVTIAEAEEIAKWLTTAKPYCDRRNSLAHGSWWLYKHETSAVEVRSLDYQGRLVIEDYTQRDFCEIAVMLKVHCSELYKLRREIENRRGWHDPR